MHFCCNLKIMRFVGHCFPIFCSGNTSTLFETVTVGREEDSILAWLGVRNTFQNGTDEELTGRHSKSEYVCADMVFDEFVLRKSA